MPINTTGIETDIPLEFAKRAYYAISFSPEKRGQGFVDDYIRILTEIAQYIESKTDDAEKAQVIFNDLRTRFKTKSTSLLSAKSRCMSSMITGPANFPVRRAEKANNAEHKRCLEWLAFIEGMKKHVDKTLKPVVTTKEQRQEDIEKLRKNIADCEKLHEVMKEANCLIRKNDIEGLKALVPNHWEKLLQPNYAGVKGFESWQLTNNLANIKRMKERLAALEARDAETGKTVTECAGCGLRIIRNRDLDRLQLIFDDVPPAEVRQALKSNGFKWSPRWSAWQRQLTPNAEHTLKRLINAGTISPAESFNAS
jgi:flagellar motility protein MotE (MotC chaperone)